MVTVFKTFELQIDLLPSGGVIRLNDEKGCVLRICKIPQDLILNADGEIKEFIDITYPQKIN
jgi:hypothetical protein